MDGTLIVAILAFIVAFGGLTLGIVNYFHARKSDEKAAGLSYEQRKQEILNLLHQSEMAIGFCETYLDFSTSRETPKYPGLPAKKEELRKGKTIVRAILETLREELLEPAMTRIQLEEHYGRSLGLKVTAENIEAMHREVYEAVRDVDL